MLLTLFYGWARRIKPYRLKSAIEALRPASAANLHLDRHRAHTQAFNSVFANVTNARRITAKTTRHALIFVEVSRVR